MRKLMQLIGIGVLVLGLVGTASAELKIEGFMALETAYGYTTAAAGGTEEFELKRFGFGESNLAFVYTSDDGRFEALAELTLYGRSDGNPVELSQGYFAYNAGRWSVLFGQTDHTSDLIGPSQTLNDANALEGFGNSVIDTHEMILFTCGEKYKWLLGIDAPMKDSVWAGAADYRELPGLTLAAELNLGSVLIHPWGHVEYARGRVNGTDDSFVSADMGLDLNGEFGLIGFSVGFNYGINTAQNDPVVTGDPHLLPNGQVGSPTQQIGVWGELRVENLAAGYGRTFARRSDWTGDAYTQAAYVNYTLSHGYLNFTPELVWYDLGEDQAGADQGQEVLVGVWTSIEF